MATPSKNPVSKRSAADYKVLGTTYDGVRVLKPRTKPKSFTTAQIRRTIREVLQEHEAGQPRMKGESSERGSAG